MFTTNYGPQFLSLSNLLRNHIALLSPVIKHRARIPDCLQGTPTFLQLFLASVTSIHSVNLFSPLRISDTTLVLYLSFCLCTASASEEAIILAICFAWWELEDILFCFFVERIPVSGKELTWMCPAHDGGDCLRNSLTFSIPSLFS